MSAVISECGKYRWTLSRFCQRSRLVRKPGTVLWVMLNPSTADASLDDPTIRRIMDFTGRWGYSRAVVVNVYGFRATDPKEMAQAEDPVGPENDYWLWSESVTASLVVLGWGKHAQPARVKEVVNILLNDNPTLYCLGVNGDGSPKHPLYLAKTTPLEPWQLPYLP